MENANKPATETPNPIVNLGPGGYPIENFVMPASTAASPIVSPAGGKEEEFQEYMSGGCAATVPQGARKIYLIVCTLMAALAGGIVFALFKFLGL